MPKEELTEDQKRLLQEMYAKREIRELGGPDPIPLIEEINRLRTAVCRKIGGDPEKKSWDIMIDGGETEVPDPLLQVYAPYTSPGGISYNLYFQIGGVHNGEVIMDSRETIGNQSFVEVSRIRTNSILIQRGPMISATEFKPNEVILINQVSGLIDLPTARRIHYSVRTPLSSYLSKPPKPQ